MEKKINLPGFDSTPSISTNPYRSGISEPFENGIPTITPQSLKDSLFGGAIVWALRNAAYAGCWWACVIDGNGAVTCKRECEGLKF